MSREEALAGRSASAGGAGAGEPGIGQGPIDLPFFIW